MLEDDLYRMILLLQLQFLFSVVCRSFPFHGDHSRQILHNGSAAACCTPMHNFVIAVVS